MKEFFYDWGGANVWLFHAINDVRSTWWDSFMQLGTTLGDHHLFVPYLCLLALFALINVGRSGLEAQSYRLMVIRWMSVVAVFSIGYLFDGLLLGYLKPLLDFPRPPLALPAGSLHVIGEPEYHHSLPSGHASFALLVAASLWPILSRKWRMAAVGFVVWVGISRVSLGMHFPADVLAGFLSSMAVVVLVRVAVQKLMRLAETRFHTTT